jgi:hypothetical protein
MAHNSLTVQSNIISLSRSNFTVPQRRILYAVIETLSPYLRRDLNLAKGKEIQYELGFFDISKITYKASDICEPRLYGELRTALRQLKEKHFFIETSEMAFGSSFVLKYNFKERSEIIELAIDEELYKMIIDLSAGYTLYQTKVVLSLSSIYAMKMYEIVAKWRNVTKFFITLEELKRLTDTIGKYSQIKDFKKRVLDISKEQLDKSEITDLRFKYKEKKEGKRIIGFEITVIKTENAHEFIEVEKANTPSLRWNFSKDLLENFASYGVNLKGKNLDLIVRYQATFGEKKLIEELEYYSNKAVGKTNIPAYIISCFKKALDQPQVTQQIQPTTIPKPIGSIISEVNLANKEVWEMTPAEKKEYIAKKRAIDNEPLI